MLALARVVVEKTIRDRHVDTLEYFTGLTLTAPPTKKARCTRSITLLLAKNYSTLIGKKCLALK